MLSGRGLPAPAGTRLLGQLADGVLQAGLASYVLFSPERQATGAPDRRLVRGAAAAVLGHRAVRRRPHRPVAAAADPAGREHRALGRRGRPRRPGAARRRPPGKGGVAFVVLALCALGVNRFILAALSAPSRTWCRSTGWSPRTPSRPQRHGRHCDRRRCRPAGAFLAGSGDAAAAGIVGRAARGRTCSPPWPRRCCAATQLGPDRSAAPPRLGVRAPRTCASSSPASATCTASACLERARRARGLPGDVRDHDRLVVLEQRGLFHRSRTPTAGCAGSASASPPSRSPSRSARSSPRPPSGGGGSAAGSRPAGDHRGGLAALALPFRAAARGRRVRARVRRPGGQGQRGRGGPADRRRRAPRAGLRAVRRAVQRRVRAAVALAACSPPVDGQSVCWSSWPRRILVVAGLWYARVRRAGWRPGQEGGGPPPAGRPTRRAARPRRLAASSGPRSSRSSSRKR